MERQRFETSSTRLRFRRLRADDFMAVAAILGDAQTMYAWQHGFSYDEVCDWIADMLRRYREDGCGCFAALDRTTDELIALAGLLHEPLANGETGLGLIYIVRRDRWQQGYGNECAQAMLSYAFDCLHAERVVALIQPSNIPSLHVAAACGLRPVGRAVKHYQGKQLLNIICAVDRPHTE